MLLPGVGPHHTRQSFASRSRLYVELYAPEVSDYVKSQSGLWQLPAEVSEWDRWRGEEILHQLADRQVAESMTSHANVTRKGARLLGRSVVTATGCIVGGLRGNQKPEEWVLWLSEQEWGGPVFTEEDELEYLSTCDEPECYNTRHYDIEFGRPTLRERKVEINPNYYRELDDGKIETIWGDKLPSIKESLSYFIEFQHQNYPFVPAGESPLTPTSLSQIRFHPVTGCWETWQYYCKPQDNLNWQFDGYGRLYQRLENFVDHDTGEIIEIKRRGHWMAHRVVWLATGHSFRPRQVLNHLCSYRRCCNPLHIEQVDNSSNVLHGRRVRSAIREFDGQRLGTEQTHYIHPKYMKDAAKRITELYFDIANVA